MIRGQGRPNAGSIALLGILAIFWGINWPILKIGVAEVPPWVFRSFGGVVAAFGLFAVARLSRAPLRVPSGAWGPLALCALLNMAVWNVLMLYGVALMDSGRAAILAMEGVGFGFTPLTDIADELGLAGEPDLKA